VQWTSADEHLAPRFARSDEALERVDDLLSTLGAELVQLRRELHAHPELSGQEYATTEALISRLRSLGLQPTRLRTGTGLVCDIGTGGPIVALRADIDALAMADGKDVPYRSQVDGAAHACGHDVHTAVLVGAAHALVAGRGSSWTRGTVRLIFEPSEESVPGGAVDVVAEGWLEGVGAIFGLHCDPKIDVGLVAVRPGPFTSAADMVQIELSGPGGHTARPGLTVDLLAVLGRLLTEVPAALDRGTPVPGTVRMVFGAAHAGDAGNVIPAQAVVRGTLRTQDRDSWAGAPELVEKAVAEVLDGTGATWRIDHRRGVPPVVNDRAATEVIAAAARRALGDEQVVLAEQSWGGDSFAWYTDKVPGSYARLGVHDPARPGRRLDLHASTFDVDEAAIGYGVRVLAAAALAMLARLSGE
jgi:amidohydrolase